MGATFLLLHINFYRPYDELTRGDVAIFSSLLVYFMTLLFITNTLLSSIFLLELVSTIIFILTFAWNTSYTSQQLPSLTITRQVTPNSPLEASFFLFWTSFVVAIVLFFTLISLINLVGTLDWYLLEIVSYPLTTLKITTSGGSVTLLTSLLFLTFMFKAALVPFFFWKPIFFRYLTTSMLSLYIIFFYTCFLIWIVLFRFTLSPIIATSTIILTLIPLSLGLLSMLMLLSDSSQLQPFLAVSSIFNTLLIWMLLVCSPSLTMAIF